VSAIPNAWGRDGPTARLTRGQRQKSERGKSVFHRHGKTRGSGKSPKRLEDGTKNCSPDRRPKQKMGEGGPKKASKKNLKMGINPLRLK